MSIHGALLALGDACVQHDCQIWCKSKYWFIFKPSTSHHDQFQPDSMLFPCYHSLTQQSCRLIITIKVAIHVGRQGPWITSPSHNKPVNQQDDPLCRDSTNSLACFHLCTPICLQASYPSLRCEAWSCTKLPVSKKCLQLLSKLRKLRCSSFSEGAIVGTLKIPSL